LAIMLCDIGEHSIEEASAVLGLAPNTVKVRLHRGRARLGLAMRRGYRPRNVPDVLIGV
jgi:DNA-directed RNA polymerase specialized sigma24 family protein